MEKQVATSVINFASGMTGERERLVRLCATLTGDRDAAEDLAQETLIEAWRHRHELHNPEKHFQWLSGIARNVCLRWKRKRGHDLSHLLPSRAQREEIAPPLHALEETLADNTDIEVEIEHKELITLLDKALALLPPETQDIFIKRYVEESSLAEVAAQLGTNPGAIAMRLQRGKLALRRVLTQELNEDLTGYCIDLGKEGIWEESSIWCIFCGQHRLRGKFREERSELLLKCPGCCPNPNSLLSESNLPSVFAGVKGFKPAFSRLAKWSHTHYRAALQNGVVPCINCGRTTAAKIEVVEHMQRWIWTINERVLTISCSTCHIHDMAPLEFLVLSLPEGQQFWRTHPRIRILPKQYIERYGRPAIITRIESLTDTACFDVVSDYATYAVLHIQQR